MAEVLHRLLRELHDGVILFLDFIAICHQHRDRSGGPSASTEYQHDIQETLADQHVPLNELRLILRVLHQALRERVNLVLDETVEVLHVHARANNAVEKLALKATGVAVLRADEDLVPTGEMGHLELRAVRVTTALLLEEINGSLDAVDDDDRLAEHTDIDQVA